MSDNGDSSDSESAAQQVRITAAQRRLLTDALVVPKPFHAEGVWTFPKAQFNLFYRAQGSCGCIINLSKNGAIDAALKALADACQPATFGLNQNDVLDETYRKAGKMDNEDFAVNLDIVGSGLLDAVNDGLFGWQEDSRYIRAELYKLNVYGPGSFFKPHRDTPRSEMFGSLVLTFATAHEGGSLVLRHDGAEVEHATSDSSGLETPYQVFWAAFFSDVEHEVFPVTSGHRVTLTFNLYYTEQKGDPRPQPSGELVNAFDTLLADKTFMPDGGRLGFGLRHAYPVSVNAQWNSDWFMSNLLHTLKGNDHALFAAAEKAGLAPHLRVVYDDSRGSGGVWMMSGLWPGEDGVESIGDALRYHARRNLEVLEREDGESYPKVRDLVWIIPRNDNTEVGTHYGCYRNEASSDVFYGTIVLIVTVPSAEDRTADN